MQNILEQLQTIQNNRTLPQQSHVEYGNARHTYSETAIRNRQGVSADTPSTNFDTHQWGIHTDTENRDPVVYAQYQFDALKSFMRRQPSNWAPTGDAATDAAKRARFALRDTATGYANTIRLALKDAADIYKMGSRMEVNIRYPQTPYDRINADQQRRIVDMNKEFEEYTRQHGIYYNR